MRFSDALAASHEPTVIGSYIECSTSNFKTANTTKRRSVPLPIAGPASGLMDVPWGVSWLELRAKQGLVVGGNRPLMPRPHSTGGWSSSSVSNSEANVCLRLVLRVGVVTPEDLTNLGTHSCKATPLSWAAKGGLGVEDRLKLGSHLKTSGSADVYARDVLGAPSRALMELYSSIRKGDFEPDGDRSGRWAEDREQALKNPEISESDSSDTESGESSDGEIVAGFTDSLHRSKSGAQGEEVIPGTSRAEFPGCEIYKHVKTHFFHVGAEVASAGHSAKMRCGRRSRFFALVSEEAVVLPKCATCFRD